MTINRPYPDRVKPQIPLDEDLDPLDSDSEDIDSSSVGKQLSYFAAMFKQIGGGPHWNSSLGTNILLLKSSIEQRTIGPNTSTDNAISRFHGTTGKQLQDSNVIIDDDGNITTSGTINSRNISDDGANLDSHIHDLTNPHDTSLSNINSGTLADLNSAIIDATIDSNTDQRPPTTHGVSHTYNQSDQITVNSMTSSPLSEGEFLEADGANRWNRKIAFLADGSRKASDDFDLNNKKITNLALPDSGTDAVNRDYVFSQINNLEPGAGLTKTGSRFDIGENADGSITINEDDIQVGQLANDAQHGSLGRGNLHQIATQTESGFMAAIDKTKLDNSGQLSNNTPTNISVNSSISGVSTESSRSDHQHLAITDTPTNIGTTNQTGTANSFSRSDHQHNHGAQTDDTQHAIATAISHGFMSFADKSKLDGIAPGSGNQLSDLDPVDVDAGVASAGTSLEASRQDHKHSVSVADPVPLGDSIAQGSADSLTRSDHIHTHGDRPGGSLHAVVTPSINGFMSFADKSKLDGIDANARALTDDPPVNVTKLAAQVGGDTKAARADHKHDILTTNVLSVHTSNQEGESAALSRADHRHKHGEHSDPLNHAVVTTLQNGFMIATDKVLLDKLASFSFIVEANCLAGDSIGDIVCVRGDIVSGKYQVEKSDISDLSKIPGFAVIVSKSGIDCEIQLFGLITGIYTGLSYGQLYWVGLNGRPETPRPIPSPDPIVTQPIGMALSDDVLFFSPMFFVGTKRIAS